MKKEKLFFVILWAFVFPPAAYLQEEICKKEICSQNGINISTGFNSQTNGLYAPGGTDDNWELISVPPTANFTVPRPAFVTIDNNLGNNFGNNNHLAWTADTPNSMWISGEPTVSWPTDNPDIPYVFERCFCYCNSSPIAQVTLNMKVWADDVVDLELFDGNGGFLTTIATGLTGWVLATNNTVKFVLNPFIQPKHRYCLRAALKNTGQTAMGLNIEGTISSGAFESDECCSPESNIIGFKYLDRNCDGSYEHGDPGLPNWTIQLVDAASGNVVAVSVTDAGGYYGFNDVPPGNYFIQEISQAGWTSSSPVGGKYANVVVVANQIIRLDFLNCREEIPPGQSCCPELRNLIENGDFSHGNSGFHSNYLPASAISPNSVSIGEYAVVNSGEANTICPNWNVEGHTPCPSTAGRFLVVNGETNQQTNAGNVIWGQSVFSLQPREGYVFCASFKNLSQCCFDIQPRITVQYRNLPSGPWITLIPWTTINEDASDRCAWEELSQSFTALTNGVRFRILLDETSAGDGNDLAIDDISLHHQLKQQVAFTIKENYLNSSSFEIEASIQNPLPGAECLYYWQIAELSDPNDPFNPSKWIDSDFGGTHPIGSANPSWGLTTNFPGGIRNGEFDFGKDYLICLFVEDCTCFADASQRKKIIFYPSRRGKSRQFVETISWDSVPLEKQEIVEKYLDKIEKNRDF